jgi:hypothetical protein
MKPTYHDNRFERWAKNIKRNKVKSVVFLFLALFITELCLVGSYVTKRIVTNYPYTGLIEQYYILRPFRKYFPDQYNFPDQLWPNFKGEIGSGQGARALYAGDGLLGYRLIPSSLTVEESWTWRATNEQGLIISDPESPLKNYAIPKPNDIYRIIVLGGSTVEGDGATGSLATLPAKLNIVLNESFAPEDQSGRRFEVINAGVGGYASAQELLYFLSSLRKYSPDLVISYNGWNDLKYENKHIELLGENAPHLLQANSKVNNDILNNYFSFWFTLRHLYSLAAQRTLEFAEGFAILHLPVRAASRLLAPVLLAIDSQHSDKLFFSPKSVERYVDNIELLHLRNRADNVDFAWFLQPLVGLGNKPPNEFREKGFYKSGKVEIQRRQLFYRLATARQKDVAKKYALSPAMCAGSLTDVFDGNGGRIYEDSGHLFDIGNILVAKRIALELKRCGLIVSSQD